MVDHLKYYEDHLVVVLGHMFEGFGDGLIKFLGPIKMGHHLHCMETFDSDLSMSTYRNHDIWMVLFDSGSWRVCDGKRAQISYSNIWHLVINYENPHDTKQVLGASNKLGWTLGSSWVKLYNWTVVHLRVSLLLHLDP